MTIPDGTIIEPGQFLTYSYQTVWFTDSSESVELKDGSGVVVDKTPVVSDIANDFTSWQRIYDGFDSDNTSDWKFATSTAGSSNGKLVETQDDEQITVTVSSDKSAYLFGETATISGSVSEEIFIVKPFFQQEPVLVTITGPNYQNIISLYPDRDLNYETTLSLHQVLGINEGNYDVSIGYGGVTVNTSFSVGFEIIEQEADAANELTLITDKSQYIPGQFIYITGTATEIIPFEGMKFTLTDSRGEAIATGNLFPTDGKFSTQVYVTTVDPGYGTYEINAEYFDKSISHTFEVVEDFKEDVPISLWSDKVAYGLGDTVEITGRLNQIWISTLDLTVTQTKQTSIGTSVGGSDAGFSINDGVTIMGDGTFSYSFTIPNNQLRLGDYRINVSKDIGSASVVVHAVDDPENFVVSTDPLTIESDKEVYELGESMMISGYVQDPYESSSYTTGSSVDVTISHEDGRPLEIIALPNGAKTRTNDGLVVGYTFTAIPETSGRYMLEVQATPNIFSEGNFVVKSEYGSNTASKVITISDPLALSEGAIVTLDKDVYGLGETVYLSGIVPPIGTNTVDISLTRPDGSRTNSGTTIDNQRFSWTWNTPIAEKYQNIKTNDGRDVVKSNFGIYKIKVATDSESVDVFFKVSEDPVNDSLSDNPIFVSTEKALYEAGDKLKVVGNVIPRSQGDEGLVIPERVIVRVLDGTFPYDQIHEATLYPTQGGDFSSLFELPATIFSEGSYTVKAFYLGSQAESTFGVANDFAFGVDEPVTLLLATDKTEYYPGESVVISGKPNKLVYFEKYDVSVIQKAETEITCGSFFCGKHAGPVTSIRPSPSGSFAYEFVIPDDVTAVGSYEATVDADFETKSIQFEVIEKPMTPKLDTVIEKENRIAESTIPIFTEDKITEEHGNLAPRVISGSLITPERGEESDVNLKVSTVTGVCIIGPDADCKVRESTRKPGQIYDVVEVDGLSLNVRYSGPDVRLEKFSILPESSTEFLPDANWNVEVIKDDQVSRFYYKITYKTIE